MYIILGILEFLMGVENFVRFLKENRVVSLIISLLCFVTSGLCLVLSLQRGDIEVEIGDDVDDGEDADEDVSEDDFADEDPEPEA